MTSEVDIDWYHVIRIDYLRRGGRLASCIRKSLSYNHKSGFFPNTEYIFVYIFLSKSKPYLVVVIYWVPGKPGFID